MSWYLSLPPAEAHVPCGAATHVVRWEAGRLALAAHPDVEAEVVLAALGGTQPRCVAIGQTWARHAADLDVLTLGPRSPADEVMAGWQEAEADRASWFGLSTREQLPPGLAGRITSPGSAGPGGGRRSWLAPERATEELSRRAQARVELMELLALGPAFQFRLAGTVAAAWSAAGRRRPELIAALSGRFAPAAHDWLGIDPDAVHVTALDEAGPAAEVPGAGPGPRLRASLPVSWLAAVWACGLAIIGGHLVIGVERPGWPRARVRALSSPGATPVPLDVMATGEGPGGLPRWEIADVSGH
jgi:hypothetical protein